MHSLSIDPAITQRVVARVGRAHPFDRMDPARTALIVVDMQNFFLAPGYPGEIAMARAIVPNVNRLAAGVRARGGHVVWIKNASDDTLTSWSVFQNELMSPAVRDRRLETLHSTHEGHALWRALERRAEDSEVVKTRFSAFIQGSSDLADHLRRRGLDTLLIAGTATNVCCESTARDAMMLNFRTTMVHDALATYSDAEHNAALSAFYAMFGDVQSVDEALAALDCGRRAAA